MYYVENETNWHCLEFKFNSNVKVSNVARIIAVDLKKQGLQNLGFAAFAEGRRLLKTESMNSFDLVCIKFAKVSCPLTVRAARCYCDIFLKTNRLMALCGSILVWQKTLFKTRKKIFHVSSA